MPFLQGPQTFSLLRIALLGRTCALIALGGIGCSSLADLPPLDQYITLRYTPARSLPALDKPRPLTIFQFADRRESTEGGDEPYWVGAVGRDKVIADTPVQWTVTRALAGGFRARGVDATAIEDRELLIGAPLRTPLALGGEIRAFSHWRWSARVEISMVLRLYDSRGTLLLEKPVAIRRDPEMDLWLWTGFSANKVPYLEKAFGEALEEFVRTVVTDPEICALLTRRD